MDAVYNWGTGFANGEEQGNDQRNKQEEFWLIIQHEWELLPKKEHSTAEQNQSCGYSCKKKKIRKCLDWKNNTDTDTFSFF